MTTPTDDTRPFPIQGDFGPPRHQSSTIPWWLAEEAYKIYHHHFASSNQSLQRLADRGGFGRQELLMLLRDSPHL